MQLRPRILSLQTGIIDNADQNVNVSGATANSNSNNNINNNNDDNVNSDTTVTTSLSDIFTFHGTIKIKNMCATETLNKIIVYLINFVVVRYGQHEMLHKVVVGKTCIPASV